MNGFFDLVSPIYEWFRPGARGVFDRLAGLVEFRPTDSIVDIGGGTGAIARYFVGKVRGVTVIDPSRKMIERCRRHPGLSCVVGRGESLPLADGSVDRIVMVDAFHHLPEQTKSIQEMKRALRADGVILIGEYDPRTLGGKSIALLERLLCLGSSFHAPARLAELFTDQGFAVQLVDEGEKDYFLIARKRH